MCVAVPVFLALECLVAIVSESVPIVVLLGQWRMFLGQSEVPWGIQKYDINFIQGQLCFSIHMPDWSSYTIAWLGVMAVRHHLCLWLVVRGLMWTICQIQVSPSPWLMCPSSSLWMIWVYWQKSQDCTTSLDFWVISWALAHFCIWSRLLFP